MRCLALIAIAANLPILAEDLCIKEGSIVVWVIVCSGSCGKRFCSYGASASLVLFLPANENENLTDDGSDGMVRMRWYGTWSRGAAGF